MKIGKIPESVLKRSILKKVKSRRKEVIAGSAVGEDCGVLRIPKEEVLLCTVDPITVTEKGSGYLAVHVSANNLAASGAEPVAIMVSILLHPSAKEEELKEMMDEVERACEELNIQVLGGHTEVTDAVNRNIITVTGMGKAKEEDICYTSRVEPGLDLVVTKWIGLEGTAILAAEKKEELIKKFPSALVEEGEKFSRFLSIVPEAVIGKEAGAVTMHDVTGGGIFGALWEMAESGGVGLEAELKKIPIRQETIEICEYFGLNPYVLMSTGSLLIGTRDGQGLVFALEKAGIPAVMIGRTTPGNDRVLINGEERRFLEKPQPDELYKGLK